ncbi:MAG: tetratricopeptide repeat protein [Verrucomicrobiales bacterium]
MLGVLANPGFESFGTERRRIPLVRPLARIALIGIGAWLCWGASHFGKAERIMEQAQFTGIDEDMGLKKIDLLRQAKEIDPDNFYLYYTSGQTWMAALNGGMPDIVAKSFVEKALADFDYARTLYPYDYINYQNIALCLTWLRRYDEAETMLKEAIRWAPNHNPPWMDYARFLTQQGRLKEAEEAYEKARRGAYHERIVDTEIALLRQRMKAEGIPTMLDAPKPE